MKVAIIGGGLAGTSCAYVLRQAGAEAVIYEAGPELAPGASGNALGLYNPRLSAERMAESDFYGSAFALALRVFSALCHPEGAKRTEGSPDHEILRCAQDDNFIDWNPCGALHLITDEKRDVRYKKMLQNWGWPEEEMQILSAQDASETAGIALSHEALYLPQSGFVSPKKLCSSYAQDIEVRLNMKVENLDGLEADAVILACGMGVQKFIGDLGLKEVRGQITQIVATPETGKLQCALCYGGYTMPAHQGAHWVGSTFQRWLDHSDILDEDDADNIVKFCAVTDFEPGFEILDHRASVRTTSKDHFPLIGRAAGVENLYLSTAHGSHGILSSLMGAHLLADMILGRPRCLPKSVIERLSPERASIC